MNTPCARPAALPLCLAACLAAGGAMAQIAVSVSDNKVVLDNGVPKVQAQPQPDTLAIIDMKSLPPRLLDEINVPASVAGTAQSVAVAPDESLALVTSALTGAPGEPAKLIADNRMSVIDLSARPPRILATLATGEWPAGVAINRAGTLALVANHGDCSVSVFGISGKTVAPAGKVALGGARDCGASQVAISPDGRSALVTRDNDHKISVLSIDGAKVADTGHALNPGLRPGGIDICMPGTLAVVANAGGPGAAATLSVIDMTASPVRVSQSLGVGQAAQSLKCSPDGSYVAVLLMNAGDKPAGQSSGNVPGQLVLYMAAGKSLQKFGELQVGSWPQGLAFAPDGLTVLVQSRAQQDIQVLRIDGMRLVDTGQRIALKGGGAALRTADKPR